MPLFDYQCAACGRTFEHLVRGRESAVSCPACGGAKVRKLLSVPARPVSAGAAAPACEALPPGGCCGGGACGLN
jgi:putative FmdB family regulatory protein